MATKIQSVSIAAARIILGLIYFVFGLNFFINFIPMSPPAVSTQAEAFSNGLFQSGYLFQLIKGVEILFGLFLLLRLFVPLSLIVLIPITLNILLFHLFLVPDGTAMAVIMIVAHLFLAWAYREYYQGLFSIRSKATL